jgi:hypothetical protein
MLPQGSLDEIIAGASFRSYRTLPVPAYTAMIWFDSVAAMMMSAFPGCSEATARVGSPQHLSRLYRLCSDKASVCRPVSAVRGLRWRITPWCSIAAARTLER